MTTRKRLFFCWASFYFRQHVYITTDLDHCGMSVSEVVVQMRVVVRYVI